MRKHSYPIPITLTRSLFKLAIFGSIFMIVSILVPAYVFQANIIETIWVLSIGQTLYLAVVIYAVLRYLKKFENEKDL